MKHIKTIILVVTIFSFLSFQTTDSIEGKWELVKMEDGDGTVKEGNGRWMHFMKDGVLEGGNSPGKTNRTGTWTYDSKTKELSFGSEKRHPGEGTYIVHWIDEKNISLPLGEGRKVYLKRIKA